MLFMFKFNIGCYLIWIMGTAVPKHSHTEGVLYLRTVCCKSAGPKHSLAELLYSSTAAD